MKRTALLAIAALAVVTGCSSMEAQKFAAAEPRFVLEEYFQGKTRAAGIFVDRFGNLRRQFVVDIVGSWNGRELVLEEDFSYSDGEKDRRVWRIAKLDAHRYQGRAHDVVGTAQGESYGNVLNWQYDLDLKVGNNVWRVHFDDWMFLQQDGVLLNRASVSKWGVELGTVFISFSKETPVSASRPRVKAVPRDGAAAG